MKKFLCFAILILLVFPLSCGRKTTRVDTVPPSCEITFPSDNYTVPADSNAIEIRVDAEDNEKVARVEFYIDSELSYTLTQSPWRYRWVTVLYDDSSSHTIFAVAYDEAENFDSSSTVDVLVRVKPGLHFVGQYTASVGAHDLFVDDHFLYVAYENQGIWILDVQNPAYPQPIGQYNTDGKANGIFVSGSHAYIADGTNGLQIADVTTPSDPQQAGWFSAA